MLNVLSPAKINWFLHINGKREDGYHDLQTCFQFINLFDEMTFEALHTPQLQIEGMDIPLSQNLIYKAAKALQAIAPDKGVKISIKKRIPQGGGLGGGSSNAATTLLALNQLWELELTKEELIDIGAKLGADVPVFIFGQGCFAQGIGEKLSKLDLPSRWLVLITPDCQVSTKELFHHPELTTNTSAVRIEALKQPHGLSLRPPGYQNVFEPLVRKLYTHVGLAMDWLESFGQAYLSGTGSSVFAPFESEQAAKEIVLKLPRELKGMVVQTLNHSPALSCLEAVTVNEPG